MARHLAALLLVIGLAGCSAAPPSGGELRPALSEDALLLDVPAVAAGAPGECGLACLGALLRYHGLELDDDARARFPRAAATNLSITAGELRAYLRGRGLRAHLVRGTLDSAAPAGLLSLVARSLPVIVELRLESGVHHYVLVCGFDLARRWVLVMDPSRGVSAVAFADFERYWRGGENLMLVAAPPVAAPGS